MITTEQTAQPTPTLTSPSIQLFDLLTKRLMTRYGLSEPVSAATLLSSLAAVVGGSVRIRNPFGHNLPLQFEFAHCADMPSTAVGDALGIAMAALSGWSSALTQRKAGVSDAELEAYLAELLTELHARDKEAVKALPPLPQPGPFGYTTEAKRIIREQEEERRRLLETFAQKKREVSQMKINIHPLLVAENPSWEAILELDQLTGDGALSITSCDGSAMETLAALRGKKLRALSDIIESSRLGQPVLLTSGGNISPAINTAFVVGFPALSLALNKPSMIRSGLLDGVVFLDSAKTTAVESGTRPTGTELETQWLRLLNRFFECRTSGIRRVFELDGEALAILEEFRGWVQAERFRGQLINRFARRWPDIILKISLAFELLINGSGSGSVGVQAMSRAVRLMKVMCEEHADIVNRLVTSVRENDEIANMTAKVLAAGRLTRRSLRRKYDNLSAKRLQAILDQAIGQGLLCFDGTYVSPGPGVPASDGTHAGSSGSDGSGAV